MNPFAMALTALFNAAGAVAAEYQAPGALPMPIRVVWAQGSVRSPDKSDRRIADTNEFDIRRAEVAAPAKGATITVTDQFTSQPLTFRINGAPILDVEGLSWTCPAEPV